MEPHRPQFSQETFLQKNYNSKSVASLDKSFVKVYRNKGSPFVLSSDDPIPYRDFCNVFVTLESS